MPPIDRMAASPSADWKAAASEARTAFPSSRWPATWVARSTVAAGCVLPFITRRAASSAVGGGRDVEGDAVSKQRRRCTAWRLPSSCGGRQQCRRGEARGRRPPTERIDIVMLQR